MSVIDHYNAVASSPPPIHYLQNMRKVHNAVKWKCFQQAISIGTCRVPYRVFDIACGRGGDYVKHASAGVCCTYFGVDVADHALNELERRAVECKPIPSVHLKCGDAADITWRDMDCDVCTLNFAIHYFFDSEQHVDALLRVISNSLRPRGIFCGTYFDFAYLETCPYASNNGRWPSEDALRQNAFGHMYYYKMGKCVDAPEYVVHFPTLCKMACKYGLYLCMDRSFTCYMQSHRIHLGNAQPGQRIFMFRKISI